MSDAKAETPVLWPPHAKSWLIGKDSGAGRDWGQKEKGTTEDEMAGWHHWLDGLESGWIPGVGDGEGGLVCCDSWGCKESDTTEQLKWTELNWKEWPIGLKIFSEWSLPDWLEMLSLSCIKSVLAYSVLFTFSLFLLQKSYCFYYCSFIGACDIW